ncbi:MAG: hypothetical protein ACI4TB_01945 [Lachnospiraceae bacterium]
MKRIAWVLGTLAIIGTLICAPAYTYQAQAFTEEETAWIEEARSELSLLLNERTVMALVYLSDMYPVRVAPSEDSDVILNVPSGQQVQIQDVVMTEEYEAWAYVSFYYQEAEYTGYVQRQNLACSDELFLQWELDYGMNPSLYAVMTLDGTDAQSTYADIEQFPESYRAALTALKEAHPNWTFVKMNTGLDWNTVVAEEMKGGRSLVPASFPVYMQEGSYSKNWAYASEDTLKYYLDPRNGLNENYIFQFEQLTYNGSYHTAEAVQTILQNTFMKGNIAGTSTAYAQAFYDIGRDLQVSPFHLACRVYQEQGAKGTSPLISGTYPGYEGYYNYFNIGASGSTDTAVITSGLQYAKDKGWNTVMLSLSGGAQTISANYILKGQDTLYLQKFDVDGSYNGLYWHQYMQNICAPTSEGSNIRKLYENTGALDNTFVFKIPVYNNMPESACTLPTASNSVSLPVLEGYNDAQIYLDGVAYSAVNRNGYYVTNAPDGTAQTAVMYRYDENGVPVGMAVWMLSYNGTYYTATEIPELRDLLTYHGFSIRITGRSGIRFKTGIAVDVRNALTADGGIGGYQLKEYGTLVMNNANRDVYPMIRGGEKVKIGCAYGLDSNGTMVDNIYETVNNRYRYTSVLVGLPVEQYKTEFAFRGYIVLTKDGKEITLYGPVMARSIYGLAEQALGMNMYPQGSGADTFLRQLIADADALQEGTTAGGAE